MQSPRKIAVAGATGRVGRHTVDVLRERGHDVVRMSRSQGVDLITGNGLATEPVPAGALFTEVAGPWEETLIEMARLLAARRGYPPEIEGVSDPADPDRELNENGGRTPS